MAKTGFRVDVSGLKRKLTKASELNADKFTPELLEFARKSLATASRLTPARDYSLIRKNQLSEYDKRVNFIPDSHSLSDPSLRVNGRQHWLYFSGKWWNASDWVLPPDAWNAYQMLMSERERRLQYKQSQFIKDRAQARFLYKKSWVEIGESLGVQVASPAQVRNSTTRRKPKKNPPRGYAQMRGGKLVKSIVVKNPFLQTPSKYIDFDWQKILAEAMAIHEEAFSRSVSKRMRGFTSKI